MRHSFYCILEVMIKKQAIDHELQSDNASDLSMASEGIDSENETRDGDLAVLSNFPRVQ